MALVDQALEKRLVRIFDLLIARRWLIIIFYAGLIPAAGFLAVDIPRDNSIERMVVATDPDVAESRRFQEIFPQPVNAFLMLETAQPFSRSALVDLDRVQEQLDEIDGVSTVSVATVWSHSRPGSGPAFENSEALATIDAGTSFFRRQGLVGDDFIGLVLALDAGDSNDRDRALAAIDEVTTGPAVARSSITAVRSVGKPWIDAWLEHETSASTARFFPLFGVFVVSLVFGLYRSVRALVAILVSLAAAVLMGMAFAGLANLSFSIVSSLVPLTLMVTATASLVYLHSRFVDQPVDVELEVHRTAALANKFVAVSASVFAASVGFAALTVSNIRPIRELGIWTSGGLLIGWFVCFTLYPALQVILRTPTRRHRRIAGAWVEKAAIVIPVWSYRWRWPLVVGASLLAVAGLIAMVGFPGMLPSMPLETDALAYVDPDIAVARDTRYFEENVLGLKTVKVWVTTPPDGVLDRDFLRGLDTVCTELEGEEAVGSIVGLPTILRLRRYLAGLGESLPEDDIALQRLVDDLEQLMLSEPAVAQWVDLDSMAATYLTVSSKAGTGVGMDELRGAVRSAWMRSAEVEQGLDGCSYRLAGSGVLQDTIAGNLVPTLTESFGITFMIIFATFLVVFRSGPARLNAMVPSVFAILVTFLVMRLTGIPLNIATILIATTVLGVTENDQIHFFYHFLEARNGGSTQKALSHSIRVAGHAILFATLINAGGFLALTLSDLPPMRQFGVVTSMAFGLAMLADFTVLPAALWIIFKEKPAGFD